MPTSIVIERCWKLITTRWLAQFCPAQHNPIQQHINDIPGSDRCLKIIQIVSNRIMDAVRVALGGRRPSSLKFIHDYSLSLRIYIKTEHGSRHKSLFRLWMILHLLVGTMGQDVNGNFSCFYECEIWFESWGLAESKPQQKWTRTAELKAFPNVSRWLKQSRDFEKHGAVSRVCSATGVTRVLFYREDQTADSMWRRSGLVQVQTYIFRLQLLVDATADELLELIQILVERFLVLQPQLFRDDVQVSNRVHFALDVSHIGIIKSACRGEKYFD